MKEAKQNEGFILRIVILIIAIVALKYTLDFDAIEWIKSDRAQSIIQPVWGVIKDFYNWVDGLFRSNQ